MFGPTRSNWLLILLIASVVSPAWADRESRLEDDIDDLDAHVDDLRRDIDYLRDEIDDMQDDLRDMERDLRELLPGLAEAENRFNQKQNEAAEIEAAIAKEHEKVNQAKSLRDQTEREMTSKLQRSPEIIEASDELQLADRFYLAAREAVLANLLDDEAYRKLLLLVEQSKADLETHKADENANAKVTITLAQQLMEAQTALNTLENKALQDNATYTEADADREQWSTTLRDRRAEVPERVAASPEMVDAEENLAEVSEALDGLIAESKPVLDARDAAKQEFAVAAAEVESFRSLIVVTTTNLINARAELAHKRDQKYLAERLRSAKRRQLAAVRRAND